MIGFDSNSRKTNVKKKNIENRENFRIYGDLFSICRNFKFSKGINDVCGAASCRFAGFFFAHPQPPPQSERLPNHVFQVEWAI
jgi:hypothetical protein